MEIICKEKYDLRPYLEDLERRICPEEELRLEQEWLNFTDGKCAEEVFVPGRKKVASTIAWPHVMINDALTSYDLMILQQLAPSSGNLELGVGEFLCIRSNYGTGMVPSMLGAESYLMPYETDTLPASRTLAGGKEELLQIIEGYKPDYAKGLARKVFEMAEHYLEVTKGYPNISRFVHYYNPDLQGPLALAELLWGSDIYMAMFDGDEDVEMVLDFFTDLYIDFTRKWKTLCPDFDNEHSVEWGFLHRGGTVIRNDTAMNISGDMYEELVRPRDQRILEEFGGCVHFCGRGHHYIKAVSEMKGLSGINMSQPEWNDMEIIYQNTIDKGLVILGMPKEEVVRATAAGRPMRGRVHCGAALSVMEKKV